MTDRENQSVIPYDITMFISSVHNLLALPRNCAERGIVVSYVLSMSACHSQEACKMSSMAMIYNTTDPSSANQYWPQHHIGVAKKPQRQAYGFIVFKTLAAHS